MSWLPCERPSEPHNPRLRASRQRCGRSSGCRWKASGGGPCDVGRAITRALRSIAALGFVAPLSPNSRVLREARGRAQSTAVCRVEASLISRPVYAVSRCTTHARVKRVLGADDDSATASQYRLRGPGHCLRAPRATEFLPNQGASMTRSRFKTFLAAAALPLTALALAAVASGAEASSAPHGTLATARIANGSTVEVRASSRRGRCRRQRCPPATARSNAGVAC
jgi:hypothetical protein